MTSQQVVAPPATRTAPARAQAMAPASASALTSASASAAASAAASTCYQIAIRPHTDIRTPPPAFIAALAGQFDRAVELARGRMCLSVPAVGAVDETETAVRTLLHAAAAHREATTGTAVKVDVTEAYSPGDGYCHVLANCRTRRTLAPDASGTPGPGNDPATGDPEGDTELRAA